ncbi:MAG: hypothetical protein ACM3PF_05860 [Bacteroidota bacterium]
MKVLIVCLSMLVVAGIVLALSPVRIGWFAPLGFCGVFPLIAIGMMALCAVAFVVMRLGFCRTGSAPWWRRPPSKS